MLNKCFNFLIKSLFILQGEFIYIIAITLQF